MIRLDHYLARVFARRYATKSDLSWLTLAQLANDFFLRQQFYTHAYQVLCDYGGAPKEPDMEFLRACMEDHETCLEWRFQGHFGFGGKFRRDGDGRHYVSYYQENYTEALDSLARSINTRLDTLSQKFLGTIQRDPLPKLVRFESKPGEDSPEGIYWWIRNCQPPVGEAVAEIQRIMESLSIQRIMGSQSTGDGDRPTPEQLIEAREDVEQAIETVGVMEASGAFATQLHNDTLKTLFEAYHERDRLLCEDRVRVGGSLQVLVEVARNAHSTHELGAKECDVCVAMAEAEQALASGL